MLRFLIFIMFCIVIFPFIYKIMFRICNKVNKDLKQETLEDAENDVEQSKKLLNERISNEERELEERSKTLNRVKNKGN